MVVDGSADRQLRQAFPLARREGPNPQSVVELGQSGHVRGGTQPCADTGAELYIAGDVREATTQVKRLAVLGEPLRERAGAAALTS